MPTWEDVVAVARAAGLDCEQTGKTSVEIVTRS